MHLLSTMHRHEHWQQELGAFIESLKGVDFEWGKHDCCTFAAGCVDAQYHTEFVKDCTSRYTDQASAIAVIKEAGSLGKLIDQYMNRIDTPQRGSIVVFQTDTGDTTGLFLNGLVWSHGPSGVLWFNADEVEINAAWGEPKCLQQ